MAVVMPETEMMWQVGQFQGSMWEQAQYTDYEAMQKALQLQAAETWWSPPMGDRFAGASPIQATQTQGTDWAMAARNQAAPVFVDASKLTEFISQTHQAAQDASPGKGARPVTMQAPKANPASPGRGSTASTCSGPSSPGGVLELASMIPETPLGEAEIPTAKQGKCEPPVLIPTNTDICGYSPLEPVLVHATYVGHHAPKRRLPKGMPVKKQVPAWSF
uniref:Uncharacterized protein n=1 Tax=Alexandrium monilatum TaxID=311494 RepID=A0A7S4R2V6_9DINO|mmetsp:Transcript_88265/g.273492  ORF Transcript_88265/g.273492 Transcript_88265/m.273492 type:complete len:219 (+) Transcript_88265:98-754(+)